MRLETPVEVIVESVYELAKNSFEYALIGDDLKEKYLSELEAYYLKNL